MVIKQFEEHHASVASPNSMLINSKASLKAMAAYLSIITFLTRFNFKGFIDD